MPSRWGALAGLGIFVVSAAVILGVFIGLGYHVGKRTAAGELAACASRVKELEELLDQAEIAVDVAESAKRVAEGNADDWNREEALTQFQLQRCLGRNAQLEKFTAERGWIVRANW